MVSYRQSIGSNALLISIVYTKTMTDRQTALLQGTLDLLILKSLALGPLHGLGVSRRVEQITRGTFQVKPGSLFPALYRMEDAGWLVASWGVSENNRRAKFYRLTAAGRRQLDAETSEWKRIAVAMAFALQAT
jgi:PadR family transcriptional regulator PadR